MIIGFIIWSICAVILFNIGIHCRKSNEAVGFFTFTKPPIIKDIPHYNYEVSIIWLIFAGVLEIIGIPFLFLKQNSPLFILIIFEVIILLIIMIIKYLKIEAKYKK